MLKVGDKVKVLKNYSRHNFPIGSIVELSHIDGDADYVFRDDNEYRYMIEEDYEILPNFKVGGKVRLNTDEGTSDYYCITTSMIEDYDVLTISSISDSIYGGDGDYLIKVRENTYNYHSDWLELVEVPKFKVGDKVRLNVNEPTPEYCGLNEIMIDDYDILTIRSIRDINLFDEYDIVKVEENWYNYHPSWLELVKEKEELEVEEVEEIGYTIITGYHFGSPHKYSWLCDRELYNNIKLNDLVLVESKLGEQVVQVVEKSNVIDKRGIHKNIIKKLEITSK